MPKKAVAIFLLLGLLGSAIFVYLTFPRTKADFPQSNNQRPYPSSPGPNGVPAPETVPHPNTPTTPHGPSLHVMAWATGPELAALQSEADAFEAARGIAVSLQVAGDEKSYRADLQQAVAAGTPPDVCLISARDFSGLDPARDLAEVAAPAGITPRALSAFGGKNGLRAVPDEFSVDMLYYNSLDFDRAGIAYPDRHWTWDIMEAITRALGSLKLKNDAGASVYPLELPADFDLWNILCTQAGHPALDHATWHLADAESRDSHLRGLDLIHLFFRELSVAAPVERSDAAPGTYFIHRRASLLIAPSELAASLPNFPHGMTLLPTDLTRANLARVNGWAVLAGSTQKAQAVSLAEFLGARPVHRGWNSVQATKGSPSLCEEAFAQALLPQTDARTARLTQLLDRQIQLFASSPQDISSENLYAQIQAEYRSGFAPKLPAAAPNLNKIEAPEVRGL